MDQGYNSLCHVAPPLSKFETSIKYTTNCGPRDQAFSLFLKGCLLEPANPSYVAGREPNFVILSRGEESKGRLLKMRVLPMLQRLISGPTSGSSPEGSE